MQAPDAHRTYAATGLSFAQFLRQFAEVHAEYHMGSVEIVVTNNTQHQEILMLLVALLRRERLPDGQELLNLVQEMTA
ncbi:MAG: hypothetical protein HXY40_03265 [Chloroflexi bacterium]|nr:hypothetical protein [Chloroflexota bacterium]